MTDLPTPVPRTARWRARVAACVRAESGDTLVEVMVAALLVALIAAAALGGFSGVAHITESQRNEEQAAALAQQDQARLRGLTLSLLASNGTGTGNWQQSPVTIGGTSYTVTSSSQFVSGTTGQYTCSSSGGGGATADEVATTSTVTWGNTASSGSNGRTPVIVHGLITPSAGGALVASATDSTGAGLAGVTISVSGPTSTSPLTTSSSGCVVFAGLAYGSYTVTYTPPPGYTWVLAPTSGALTQTETVSAGQPADSSVQLGEPAEIQASFTTTYNGTPVPATADLFTVQNSYTSPLLQTFGTRSTATQNNYTSPLSSGLTLYPFPSSEPTSYLYNGWAGSACNAPPSGDLPQGFSLTPAGTTDVTLQEPALIVLPYTGNETQTPSYTNYTADQTVFTFSPSSDWILTKNTHDYPTTGTDKGEDEESSTTNAYAQYTLPAGTTSVTVLGTETNKSGYETVYLNGSDVWSQNLYSASTETAQQIYQDTSLSPTTSYTLKIAVAGQKGTPGGSTMVSIDEIEYTTASYTTTYSQGPLMTTAPDVTITDTETTSGCTDAEDHPPTQVPTATQGALVSPGLPYGTYTVCVDNGTDHVTIPNVANTDYTAGTQVIADIYPGVTGYGTGTCT